MAKRSIPLLWTLLIVFVSMLAVTISGIVYTGYVARENNRKWCTAVVAIDDAFKQSQSPNQSPNQSQATRRIGDAYAKLRLDFGC